MNNEADDLIERMIDACRMIDWDLTQSPKPVTRHADGGKVEVSYTCTSPRSGMVIAGEYSLDPDTAMQSLIDAIHRYVDTPTTEQERMIALHKSWYYDAVRQRNEKDMQFHRSELEKLGYTFDREGEE